MEAWKCWMHVILPQNWHACNRTGTQSSNFAPSKTKIFGSNKHDECIIVFITYRFASAGSFLCLPTLSWHIGTTSCEYMEKFESFLGALQCCLTLQWIIGCARIAVNMFPLYHIRCSPNISSLYSGSCSWIYYKIWRQVSSLATFSPI